MRKKFRFRLMFKKKFMSVLLVIMLGLMPFSNVAFAAIDSGFNSPNASGSSNGARSVDSNLTTYTDDYGNGSITYTGFTNSDTLNAWFSAGGSGNTAGKITFYDASNNVLSTTSNIIISGTTPVKKTFSVPVGTKSFTITSISSALYGANGWNLYIYEVEVNNVITHNEITNLAGTPSGNSTTINYTIPTDNSNFTGSKIYRNGTLIATLGTGVTSYTDTGLSFDTNYTYKVSATYNDNYETVGISTQITTGIMPHDEATNLGATVGFNSANLSWSIPNNQYLVGFKIYRNNVLIKTLNTIENTYTDNNLVEGTSYNYKVTSLYSDGYETPGVSYVATTNTKPHDEVTSLDATVSYNSASLSWTIPNNPYLVGFKVYRDNTLIKTLSSTDAYFDDTGLSETTDYHYKITAIYDDGYETTGVSLISTTTAEPHDEVTGLNAATTYNSSTLSWTIPNNQFLIGFNIYRDGTLIKTLDQNVDTYEDNGLNQGTSYTYKVVSVYDDSFITNGVSISAKTIAITHDEATNLNATMTNNSASLTWDVPNNPYLVGFNIYRDGKLVKNLSTLLNSYEDNGLIDLTDYKYTITSLYVDGYETPGVSNTFKTLEDPVVKQVSDAKAEAVSYKQVDVSWALPNQGSFKKVKIYRAVQPKKQGFFSAILGTIAFADTQPQEIFETNGTYFNDLTVQPDTNYQYTLKTESVSGNVSDPISVSATTPTEPTPVLQTAGNYTVDNNGSYVFKWTQPTTGTVKVLVGGQEYTTTDASQQQITIPKKDMQTTVWGDPNVSMIPIGEFGTTGTKVDVGGNKFQDSLSNPISSKDVLTTSFSLMTVLGPILLLALVFIFYKPLVRTLKNLFNKKKKGSK